MCPAVSARGPPGSRLFLGASILPLQVARRWHCHLPAAPAELRRPVTSTRSALPWRTSSGGLVLQAPGDTRSGTVEDTRVSATGSQRQKPHLGTHTCPARYSEIQSLTHTQVHTDALQGAQGHASQDSATQVSQTHTPERSHAPPRAQNSRHTRGHGDICRPPARWRHRKTHTPGSLLETPQPFRRGNNNSPAGGRSGRPSVLPLVELGAPRGGEEVGAGGGRGD